MVCCVSIEACVTKHWHRKGRKCIPLALLNKFSACWDLGDSMLLSRSVLPFLSSPLPPCPWVMVGSMNKFLVFGAHFPDHE